MKNDLFNTEIDEIIRASMKLADEPDPAVSYTHLTLPTIYSV